MVGLQPENVPLYHLQGLSDCPSPTPLVPLLTKEPLHLHQTERERGEREEREREGGLAYLTRLLSSEVDIKKTEGVAV